MLVMSEVNAAALVLLSLRHNNPHSSQQDPIFPHSPPLKRPRTPDSYDYAYSNYYVPSKRVMASSPLASPSESSVSDKASSPPHQEIGGVPSQIVEYPSTLPSSITTTTTTTYRDVVQLAPRSTKNGGQLSPQKKTFQCDGCGRRFARREHLFRHIETMHYCQKDYKCELCSRVFSRKDNMMQHIRNKHGD